MRLITLNIRFGAGPDFPERPGYDLPITASSLAALAAAVRALRPDVAALQEVANARQAQRLAEMVGMHCVYARHPSSYPLDFFEWGLAFLHRFDALRIRQRSIAFDADRRTGRNALVATLSAAGRPITLVNVHLAPDAAERQIAALIELGDSVAEPLVLMGDFNRLPDDPVLEPVHRRWRDSCRAVTTDASREAEAVGTRVYGRARIDYVFVDSRHFLVDAAGLAPAEHRRVSDHITYFADVRVERR